MMLIHPIQTNIGNILSLIIVTKLHALMIDLKNQCKYIEVKNEVSWLIEENA